jgi:hypothetical protein
MKNRPRWRNLTWATASQSHRMCVADSSSSRHLSQMGSSVNPSLKRCPFRWQCPVSSPTTHLTWSLFNFNSFFVLLAEAPHISPFACGWSSNISGLYSGGWRLKSSLGCGPPQVMYWLFSVHLSNLLDSTRTSNKAMPNSFLCSKWEQQE